MGDAWREAGADMAKLQASRVFHSAKRQALTLRHRHGEAPRWPLSDMRNAWVAYHAGAPWMTGASWGVAEAHAREAAQLREALDGVCGLTGTWAQRVGDGERDWRVRFSFEGETHFETQTEAREAGKAYERIIADMVHGENIARLTAETERLRTSMREAIRAMAGATSMHDASELLLDALARENGAG